MKFLTTFIRSKPMVFWGLIWPILWIFIGVTVFKPPAGVPTLFYYGSQIAFLLQIAFSTLSISGAIESSLDSIKLPYMLRFTKVSSKSYVSALLLSYFIFSIIQSVILVGISPPAFGIEYGSIGGALPTIFFLALISATLYMELGIIVSYVLLLLKLPRLTQVASFAPFIIMYVTVIGQVVGTFKGSALVYIPFNELYTITVVSMATVVGSQQVNYALNAYEISGTSVTYMGILLPVWIIFLALVAIGLVMIYNRSSLRGKYRTEDIMGG
jgi:hypothetical protein